MHELKNIKVVMSTYNGEKYLARQVDSIFSQKGVNVSLYVRDDGSQDSTLYVLKRLKDKYENVEIEAGKNIGYSLSFMTALKNSGDADYYAFADQDDIWFDNKLITGVEELEKHNPNIPLLFHSNRLSVDEELKPIQPQPQNIVHSVDSRIMALSQGYLLGCVCLLNRSAKEELTRYMPKAMLEHKKLSHDFWVGCLIYLIGQVYYCDSNLMYYVRYKNSVSCGDSKAKAYKKKILYIFQNKGIYENPVADLLDGYSEYFTDEEKRFLTMLNDYRHNFIYKLKVIFNKDFKRKSKIGSIAIKLAVLFNRY